MPDQGPDLARDRDLDLARVRDRDPRPGWVVGLVGAHSGWALDLLRLHTGCAIWAHEDVKLSEVGGSENAFRQAPP